ncbi:MAG: endolytic transglycosylase MltG, partial [Nitrospirae bacterium]|nr:endolytic transglycosylase MltG [Nitrospirota bacterium]
AEKIGMSENEVLTLASIIEKEARVDEERDMISAVYHNRLKKNMRLQADPTSIYGVEKMGEEITRRDLKRRTPYNTYVIKGLPPGPIAAPGIKSIRAALYPADVKYLYFVSKNDGTHHFSVTDEEHLEAVAAYRKAVNKENEEKKKAN